MTTRYPITELLVTGGCGFIGTNFIRYLRTCRPDWQIINLDCLSYCSNTENLADLENDTHYTFVQGNICDQALMEKLIGRCDGVVHFAAESHVDRSITHARPFVDANVCGTQTLLDALHRASPDHAKRFVQVSTDEVYGDLPLDRPDLKFTEATPIAPNSPYSASKAAGDLLASAYHHTYGLDVIVTRCSNNFGPYQYPEKVIPLFVTNLLEDKKVPLYGDGKNIRDWIHVDDHCQAILTVLEQGAAGEVYNIGADNEHSNLDLTHAILQVMGRDVSMIQPVADRLGHDRRYAVDSSKMLHELGWSATHSVWPGALETTVRWYVDHQTWWERLKHSIKLAGGLAE